VILLLYNRLSDYLIKRYGEKVQRVGINAGFTCPNKTGLKGTGGCIYCDSTGSSFASFNPEGSVKEQFNTMVEKRYKKRFNYFMAYFQSNTNTYASPNALRNVYSQLTDDPRVKILDISTRPDCVPDEVLDVIAEFKKNLDVFIEFGVESTNPNTLKFMNRGHGLAEVIDAVERAKKRDLEIILHFIVDFPTDTLEDVIEMAKISSVLGVQGVKLHSLYIAENTKLADMYKKGEIEPITLEEYLERTVKFLEYLDPDIVIHRMVAEPPQKGTLFGNWGMTKQKIQSMIEKKMEEEETYQGKKFNYINK